MKGFLFACSLHDGGQSSECALHAVFVMNVEFLAPRRRFEVPRSYYVKYCCFPLMNVAIIAKVCTFKNGRQFKCNLQ